MNRLTNSMYMIDRLMDFNYYLIQFNSPDFIPSKHPKMSYADQKRNAIRHNNKRKHKQL